MVLAIGCIFPVMVIACIVVFEMFFNNQAKTIRQLNKQLKHTEELAKYKDKELSELKNSYYNLYKELQAYRIIDDWDKSREVAQQYNLEKGNNYNGSQE